MKYIFYRMGQLFFKGWPIFFFEGKTLENISLSLSL